jgi:L-2-hydroxyglutarate oxidase
MVDFCRTNGVAYDVCGKVIVATERKEIPLMGTLMERGKANGIEVREISRDELRDLEPNVSGIAALHVPSTGIVNYRHVVAAMVRLLGEGGATLHAGYEVTEIRSTPSGVVVHTPRGEFETAADFRATESPGWQDANPDCGLFRSAANIMSLSRPAAVL